MNYNTWNCVEPSETSTLKKPMTEQDHDALELEVAQAIKWTGSTLPKWSRDLTLAFSLLDNFGWSLFGHNAVTDGYRCDIYGKDGLIGLGWEKGETVPIAICRAVLDAVKSPLV